MCYLSHSTKLVELKEDQSLPSPKSLNLIILTLDAIYIFADIITIDSFTSFKVKEAI